MPPGGARPGAPGTEVGGSGGRAAPLLLLRDPAGPRPRERPIAAVRRSASASRTAPSPSPTNLTSCPRGGRCGASFCLPAGVVQLIPALRPPCGRDAPHLLSEPTPDLPGTAAAPGPTAAGQPGLDSAAATPRLLSQRTGSPPGMIHSSSPGASLECPPSGRRGDRERAPRRATGQPPGWSGSGTWSPAERRTPAPPTAATHESRGQRAGTVLGRYGQAGPTRLQEDQGCPCAPGPLRAPLAGRPVPAPLPGGVPQEPTINRASKTSFKKPWKVSFTVSNKVWVLILSSPLLPELKGPEERVVALSHPGVLGLGRRLGQLQGQSQSRGAQGRPACRLPARGSGWPMTRSFAQVNTLQQVSLSVSP